MTELKTLKDIEKELTIDSYMIDTDDTTRIKAFIQKIEEAKKMNYPIFIPEGTQPLTYPIFCNRLRAEAIKWIKEIIKGDKCIPFLIDPYERTMISDWIKHFFNITEEELK